MQEIYRKKIRAEFEDCIDRAIDRLRDEDTNKPFHAALLSREAVFWSRFERSFSTSFGQGPIERVSRIAAEAGGATNVSTQKHSHFTLNESKLAAIDAHISDLRGGRRKSPPSWDNDLSAIQQVASAGRELRVRVVSDLYWVNHGKEHFMSIKTVKPNIDQTAEAKKDLLKLKLYRPDSRVYFGLYYNPYGERKSDYAWSPPRGIFNFQADEVVLIGRDYWDTLGGAGTYDEILEIANASGEITRRKVESLTL